MSFNDTQKLWRRGYFKGDIKSYALDVLSLKCFLEDNQVYKSESGVWERDWD